MSSRCALCGEMDYSDMGDMPCACRYARQQEPRPTAEDYCGGDGHAYYGDDGDVGRCYCGQRTHPLGGPKVPDNAPATATLTRAEAMALARRLLSRQAIFWHEHLSWEDAPALDEASWVKVTEALDQLAALQARAANNADVAEDIDSRWLLERADP